METDASISGVGAVLMQYKEDQKLHPVAYASRSLSAAERNYSITELETLAVVWALSSFHPYLYRQSVTIVTDHAAVQAILETPSPTGKHARWWTWVYIRLGTEGRQDCLPCWSTELCCRRPVTESMRGSFYRGCS